MTITPDIVWHNATTNEVQLWFMNGERIIKRADVVAENGTRAFVGLPWTIVGTADLNNDGNADIVWHNSTTNETQIWFMNSEHIVRRANVVDENGAGILVGLPWNIRGTADLNNDGNADIVWHNSTTNETQIWFMNSEHIVRRADVLAENGSQIRVDSSWSIVGAAGLNKDGNAHIVWHNSTTNEVQIWFMNGELIVRRADVVTENGTRAFVGLPWSIAGTADLNNDGCADIVWRNATTNEIQIWFMSGEHIIRRADVVAENGSQIRVDSSWSIVGTAGARWTTPPPTPEFLTFDDVGLTSDLPLGGEAHLTINKSGVFTFNTHAHDSGFDNIDYTIVGVLVSRSNPDLAISFTHQGGVEGTTAGLPFGTPRRDDDLNSNGPSANIKEQWDAWQGASFVGRIAGTDALLGGIEGLILDAAKAAAAKLGQAAAEAVIAVL